MRYVTVLLSVFLVGATVFVSTEKEQIRAVHDAVKVKAWIVEAGIDIPLAKAALPDTIIKHFQAANQLANAAIKLGDNPDSIMRADAVLQVIDKANNIPAVVWSLPTSDNLCASKDDLDTWGKAECAFYGRGIVGTGINEDGNKGRVVCAGKPAIRIRIYCE